MSLCIETQKDTNAPNARELLSNFKGEILSIYCSPLSEESKKEKALAFFDKFDIELLRLLPRKDGNYHKMISEALKYMTANITDKQKIQINELCKETKAKIDHGLHNDGKPQTTPRRKRSTEKNFIKKIEKLLFLINNNLNGGTLD